MEKIAIEKLITKIGFSYGYGAVMEFYLWRRCGDGVVRNGDGAVMEFILKLVRWWRGDGVSFFVRGGGGF